MRMLLQDYLSAAAALVNEGGVTPCLFTDELANDRRHSQRRARLDGLRTTLITCARERFAYQPTDRWRWQTRAPEPGAQRRTYS
jgi:hypothetical protein